MAESPSSALPGGVQWLPAIGGAHLLRAEVGRGEPPTLVLQSQRGGDHRIAPGPQTRFSRSADFLIPAGLRWSIATLVWPNGMRAVLPEPPAGRAEVIDLASRRPAPPVPQPPTRADKPAPLPWTAAREEPTAPAGTPPAPTRSDVAPSSASALSPGAVGLSPAPSSAAPRGAETAIPASRAAEVTGAGVAADGYQAARADLQADLSRAVEALSHAQETELAADGAVQALLSGAQSDLQAERAARAADLSVLGAQSQMLALRAELERARDEITQLRTALESERLARAAAEAALGTPVAPGDLTELAATQSEVSAAATRRSPEEADRLVAALEAAASSLRASIPAPKDKHAPAPDGVRSERSSLGAPLRPHPPRTTSTGAAAAAAPADAVAPAAPLDVGAPHGPAAPLDADTPHAPAGLGAPRTPASLLVPGDPADPLGLAGTGVPHASDGLPAPADAQGLAAAGDATDHVAPHGLAAPGDLADADPVVDHRPVIVATVAARAAAEAARQALAPIVVPAPGLRRALITLAHEEPLTAAALIAGLLPAQSAVLEDESLSYDLTVRGYGTFAVTLGHGGTEVQRLTKCRSRREAAFHVSGEPLVLAQLLAGERKRLGRYRPSARITGRRKRARTLHAALPQSTLSLADAVRHGARLEPALVYSALPYVVAPEWTKGHVFTVAQEIRELGPRAWYVTARDGVRLSVVEHAQGAAADATVTMSRAAFDRLLANEPPTPGDLPVIRGNREAVAALKRWTDLARG